MTSYCSLCWFFYNLFYWHFNFQTDPSTAPLKKGSVMRIPLQVLAMSVDAKISFSFSAIAWSSFSAPFTPSFLIIPLDTLASFLILMYLGKTKTKTNKLTKKTHNNLAFASYFSNFFWLVLLYLYIWYATVFILSSVVLIKSTTSFFLKNCFR